MLLPGRLEQTRPVRAQQVSDVQATRHILNDIDLSGHGEHLGAGVEDERSGLDAPQAEQATAQQTQANQRHFFPPHSRATLSPETAPRRPRPWHKLIQAGFPRPGDGPRIAP